MARTKQTWKWVAAILIVIGIATIFRKRIEAFIDPTKRTVEVPPFIPRQRTDAPKEINGVPLVVYRSWIGTTIPNRMWGAVQETMKMTPEFDNYFFTDADCLKFIEENYDADVAKAFRCLKPGAFQSDLWRCCVLYKLGGVYFDIKLEMKIPLATLLEEHPVIFVQDWPQEPHCSTKVPGLWNGIMISPPGNPIFKACIDEIVESCRTRNYRDNFLDITGPCQLGRKITELRGADAILSSPFVHHTLRQFHYKDQLFAKEYDGYREDQTRLQKTKHYSSMWNERNVFDENIVF